jgi:hypothetical protein
MWYNYSKKIFIYLKGLAEPDNQLPDYWSYTILLNSDICVNVMASLLPGVPLFEV